MEIYTNEELFRLWHESRKWERLWKQAAKKWRDKDIGAKKASKLDDVVTMVGLDDQLAIAEATATRLRGLLRRIEEWGQRVGECPICCHCAWDGETVIHAADCELARELEE